MSRSLKMMLAVFAVLIPFVVCAADDFDDFDAEKSASEKEEKNQEESDQAIKDLLGGSSEEEEEVAPPREEKKASFDEEADEEEDEEEAPKPKKVEKKESVDDILGTKKEEKKPATAATAQGIKPVIMVKGGINFGSYAKSFKQGLFFGSVDEGILGAEFVGKSVLAKATINVRTQNPLLLSSSDKDNAIQYNPLMDDNYIENSIYKGIPYEAYGGMKLFDMVTIRAGKMIPTYGILDKYQHLGVAIGTPFGTRPLLAIEGWIPETDAGFALGFNYDLDDDSGINAEFMLGTGVIPNISQFWSTQKTMGMYFKGGYYSEMFTAMLGFQYRTDYEGTAKKSVPFIGFGLGTIFSYAGFETWLTVDYTMAQLLKPKNAAELGTLVNGSTGGLSLSLMPAYNLTIDYEMIDKIQFGVRFDLNYGIYNKEAADGNYLTWYTGSAKFDTNATKFFVNNVAQMRFGVGINLFAKEIEGVHSFAGFTFMMQPQAQLVNPTGTANDVYNYGFYSIGLNGGAEF